MVNASRFQMSRGSGSTPKNHNRRPGRADIVPASYRFRRPSRDSVRKTGGHMRARILVLFVLTATTLAIAAAKTLDIYVIDVEGGNATLFVAPSGESLLIDTGNAGSAAPRDAARIIEAMRDANVRQIDHLITTHWHGDH